MCHPSEDFKLDWGNQRNAAQPQLGPTTTPSRRSPAFPAWPQTKKPTILKVAQKKRWLEVTPVPFLNPDPVTHLVGCSNKAPVIVDGQETTTLIDLGTKVSSISSQFCRDLAMQIQSLGQLLELEGTGVLSSHTLGSWMSTSRSQGSKTMRNAGHTNHDLLQDGPGHGLIQNNR